MNITVFGSRLLQKYNNHKYEINPIKEQKSQLPISFQIHVSISRKMLTKNSGLRKLSKKTFLPELGSIVTIKYTLTDN